MSYPGKFVAPYANAATRMLQDKLADFLTVEDFYQGEADHTQAFIRAAATGRPFTGNSLNYTINTSAQSINFTGVASCFLGRGGYYTSITDTAPTAGSRSTFKLLTASNGGVWGNFYLKRTNVGNAGALFDTSGISSALHLQNAFFEKGYNGLALGGGAPAYISDITTASNARDGLNLIGAGPFNATWQISRAFSVLNGRHGFAIESSVSTSLGEWTEIASQSNGQYGFAALGSAGAPISGVRLRNSFFGDEPDSGIYLNTYSLTPHLISGCHVENCGQPGIFISSNNDNGVDISDCSVFQCGISGIFSRAAYVGIVGGTYLNNDTYGIFFGDDTINARVIGTKCSAVGAGTQWYGIGGSGSASFNRVLAIGNDLTGNALGRFSPAAAAWLVDANNTP